MAKGEFDRAITDYNAVIDSHPEYANGLINRGLAYFYGGSLANARTDFETALKYVPNQPYAALWLELSERRDRRPSRLAQFTSPLDMSVWPAPLVRHTLGELTATDVLSQAAAEPDAKNRRGLMCEANFYLGELALLQGSADEAVRLFQQAARDCPRDYIEWGAARAELGIRE